MSESGLSDSGFSELIGNLYAKPYELVPSVFPWGRNAPGWWLQLL